MCECVLVRESESGCVGVCVWLRTRVKKSSGKPGQQKENRKVDCDPDGESKRRPIWNKLMKGGNWISTKLKSRSPLSWNKSSGSRLMLILSFFLSAFV